MYVNSNGFYSNNNSNNQHQFVTIVNKSTNYITSSPYAPPMNNHHQMYNHPHRQTDSVSTIKPQTPPKKIPKNKKKAMLKHFGLSLPTKNDNFLLNECDKVSASPLCSNTVPSKMIINIANAQNTEECKEECDVIYHNCFHFMFVIDDLGVFEYCNHCFTQNYQQKIEQIRHRKCKKIKDKKETNKNGAFDLDNYLIEMIDKELNILNPGKTGNFDKGKIDISLCINDLIKHCKECGMSDSFINELKKCHQQNPSPHTILNNLQCIQQMNTKNNILKIDSLKEHHHIHCIVYHPKIGCMEFCKWCNKTRHTICDNPGCLNEISLNRIIKETEMSQVTNSALYQALKQLNDSYISPSQNAANDTFSCLKSYMELNKRLNLITPKPAGPLAPHAMLIIKSSHSLSNSLSSSKNRNRSGSAPKKPMNTKEKNEEKNEKNAQNSPYYTVYQNNSHYQRYKRRKNFRMRYNKRRELNFKKIRGINSTNCPNANGYTTHHIISMDNTNSSIISYPDSVHSSYTDGGSKCLSVPPLTPMLRASSAQSTPMSRHQGQRQSGWYTYSVKGKKYKNRQRNEVEVANSVRSFNECDNASNACSETPVHSVHNGLNPEWSNPYATGSIVDVRNVCFNDAASLSSLPMSPSFSYASLPTFPIYESLTTSNLSRHSSSEHQSDLLMESVDFLNLQFNALTNNQRLAAFIKENEEEKDTNSMDDIHNHNNKEMSEEIVIMEDEEDKTNEEDEEDSEDDYEDGNEENEYQSNGFIPLSCSSPMNHISHNGNIQYPQHLINVNCASPFQSPPQLRPPFIPLSTVPQYYMLNTPQLSQLSQLPQHIQTKLIKEGLPKNAIILPIHQMDSFKQAMRQNIKNQQVMHSAPAINDGKTTKK